MSESELLKRIFELEAENLALAAENKQLRELLGLHSEKTLALQSAIESVNSNEKENNKIPTIIPIIDKYSSPEEKIELFMLLFRGRTDVYAKRCYSKNHGNSYYIPACKNEWVRGVCNRF